MRQPCTLRTLCSEKFLPQGLPAVREKLRNMRSAVEAPEEAGAREEVAPARPPGGCQAPRCAGRQWLAGQGAGGRHAPPHGQEVSGQCQPEGGVAPLHLALQPQLHALPKSGHAADTRPQLLRTLGHNAQGTRWLVRLQVSGDALLHDAGLVPGDLLDGGAQEGGVVQAQGRDAAHHRPPHDVCAVEGAADPNLHHRYLHPLPPEDVEGEDGEEFEVGRPVVLAVASAHAVVHLPEVPGELGLVNRRPVYPDPLRGGHEVGRGEEAGLEALVTEDGLAEGARGSLALGQGSDCLLHLKEGRTNDRRRIGQIGLKVG